MNCFINVYESISSVSLSELTKGKGRTQEERVLKSYTAQEFWRCFADGLNNSLVSSVAQAAKTWVYRQNLQRCPGLNLAVTKTVVDRKLSNKMRGSSIISAKQRQMISHPIPVHQVKFICEWPFMVCKVKHVETKKLTHHKLFKLIKGSLF